MKNPSHMFRASLNGIREVETNGRVSEHVDAGTWESWAESDVRAKQLLVAALEKRVACAKQSLELAEDRLKQAEALKVK